MFSQSNSAYKGLNNHMTGVPTDCETVRMMFPLCWPKSDEINSLTCHCDHNSIMYLDNIHQVAPQADEGHELASK